MSESKDNVERIVVAGRSSASANADTTEGRLREPNEFVLETARLLEARNLLTEAVDVAGHVAAILMEIGATSADTLLEVPDDVEFADWFEPLTKRNKLHERGLRRFFAEHAARKLGEATDAAKKKAEAQARAATADQEATAPTSGDIERTGESRIKSFVSTMMDLDGRV